MSSFNNDAAKYMAFQDNELDVPVADRSLPTPAKINPVIAGYLGLQDLEPGEIREFAAPARSEQPPATPLATYSIPKDYASEYLNSLNISRQQRENRMTTRDRERDREPASTLPASASPASTPTRELTPARELTNTPVSAYASESTPVTLHPSITETLVLQRRGYSIYIEKLERSVTTMIVPTQINGASRISRLIQLYGQTAHGRLNLPCRHVIKNDKPCSGQQCYYLHDLGSIKLYDQPCPWGDRCVWYGVLGVMCPFLHYGMSIQHHIYAFVGVSTASNSKKERYSQILEEHEKQMASLRRKIDDERGNNMRLSAKIDELQQALYQAKQTPRAPPPMQSVRPNRVEDPYSRYETIL